MAESKGKSRRPAARGGAERGTQEPAPLADNERRRMIAENAYYRALDRGFRGGDPQDDWLAAEREINRLLPGPKQQKAEQAAYQRLRRDVQALLADVRQVTAGTTREAIEKARAQLAQAGEYTADTVDKVAATIEKETAEAARRLGNGGKALATKALDVFAAWRDRGQAFLGDAVAATGEWIREAGTRLEAPVYRTGEMVASGTFECIACGERMVLTTDAHLPMCAKCRGLNFRRTW